MSIRHFLDRGPWRAVLGANQSDAHLSDFGSIMTFTFDDFQHSAPHVGGTILKDCRVGGTYHAAMGLINETNGLGYPLGHATLRSRRPHSELGISPVCVH
jgi:hypothetical protein